MPDRGSVSSGCRTMKTAYLKSNTLWLEHKVKGKGVVRDETRREITANFSPFTENFITE